MANRQLPLEVLTAIDSACDRFERAWREVSGEDAWPSPDDYVADLPADAKRVALAELHDLERQYRSALGSGASQSSPSESEAETQWGRFGRDSGLRAACPQCHQHVELLDDETPTQITCKACGSCFDLTQQPGSDAGQPRLIGRFLLRERLGVGGFGVVWRARDPQLDRDVALKSPRRQDISPHETELFFREARTAAQLTHPGIVSVHEVGRDSTSTGSAIYIVGELVDGESLADYLKEHRVTPRHAAALVADIAEALDYAHTQGVIHRDLKPSNIMLDPFASDGETVRHAGGALGRPRLMDFGLAKRDAGEATLTVDGQVMGTPAYMSPEQASGRVRWVDRRTDIYALGVVLFRLLTNELPFRGTASSQIQQRLTDDAPSPIKIDDRVPFDLANVCLKCLNRDPGARYANAAEVAAEMRRYLNGEPVLARPLSWSARAARWVRRRPASATALLLGAVLAIAGPAAAIRIGQANQRLLIKDQTNRDLIRRQEAKLDELAAGFKDRVAAAVSGGPATVSPQRTRLVERIIDRHGDRILAAARSVPAASVDGTEARLAAARLLIAAGRPDEAMALIYQTRPLVEAPERPTAEAVRELLNALEADRMERLNGGASPDRAVAEARLRATAKDQRNLDRLLEAAELGPQDVAAIAAALLGADDHGERAD